VQEQDIDNIQSERRNPILADLFHRLRYMERRGSGLRKIVNETKNLPGYSEELRPQFFSDTGFRVVIKNVNYPNEAINGVINEVINEAVNETITRRNNIINALSINGQLTKAELAKQFGIAKSTLDRDLAELKKQGRLKRVGSNKTGHWEVTGGNDG